MNSISILMIGGTVDSIRYDSKNNNKIIIIIITLRNLFVVCVTTVSITQTRPIGLKTSRVKQRNDCV
jgi:hypothetical protein